MKLLNGCMSRVVRARYNYNPGVDSPNETDVDVRANTHSIYVTGPANTGHICTNYTSPESGTFLGSYV